MHDIHYFLAAYNNWALTYEGQKEVLKTALAPKKDFYCVKHGGTEFYYRLFKDGDLWLIRQLDSEDVY